MNKAFLKEPDQDSGFCPRCRSLGLPVGAETFNALIRPEARSHIAETGYFCNQPNCPVVYFDIFERSVDVDEVIVPVYPKHPEAPLCACFGLTVEEVEADVAEGVVTRTRQCVELSRSPAARCATRSPAGHSCAADVQRYYMQRKAAWDRP